MAYLALDKGIVFDLGKANDRSLARVRGVRPSIRTADDL